MGIIIAAGALFTAVYDVIYKYNSSNTTNLNAATVDKTGQTSWSVEGTARNGADETTTLGFDQGTYMMLFNGQTGSGGLGHGEGAQCIAFYKGSSMTVVIGVGGGKGGASDGSLDGGGKTIVTTNFALPTGYSGELQAIAAGAGVGSVATSVVSTRNGGRYTDEELFKLMDGTFAGWTGDYGTVLSKMGLANRNAMGTPACQSNGGWMVTGDSRVALQTPSWVSGTRGLGGGAGYFDGGACRYNDQVAGGGSCTPWCYPLQSSDCVTGPKRLNGEPCRVCQHFGAVYYYLIDPMGMPSGGTVAFGETVGLMTGGAGVYTPYEAVKSLKASREEKYGYEADIQKDYDCGIRVGWVYSVSEDGKSWHGVGPEKVNSEK